METSKQLKPAYSILFAVSLAHLINDLTQAITPSLYPILKQDYNLSFSQIGLISLVFQTTASIFQPLVGAYTDKKPLPFSQIYAIFFSIAGIVSISFANNFYWILWSVMLIGFGSAIFHPEASRISNLASGGRRGLAQSIFQIGGSGGTALAPLLVAYIVASNTQKHILFFLLFSSVGIFALQKIAFWYRDNLALRKNTIGNIQLPKLSSLRVKITIGILLITIFSKFFYAESITSYYTFYLMDKFHLPIKEAQLHLFVFLIFYSIGNLLGGVLGDKIGRKHIIWLSVFGVAPFTLLLPHVNLFWTNFLMVIIGLMMASAFPSIIVYAQELLPKKIGMISGLFYGFGFGMGALGAAVLGKIADHTSIQYIYNVCAFLPLIGVICLALPNLKKQKYKNTAGEEVAY